MTSDQCRRAGETVGSWKEKHEEEKNHQTFKIVIDWENYLFILAMISVEKSIVSLPQFLSVSASLFSPLPPKKQFSKNGKVFFFSPIKWKIIEVLQ